MRLHRLGGLLRLLAVMLCSRCVCDPVGIRLVLRHSSPCSLSQSLMTDTEQLRTLSPNSSSHQHCLEQGAHWNHQAQFGCYGSQCWPGCHALLLLPLLSSSQLGAAALRQGHWLAAPLHWLPVALLLLMVDVAHYRDVPWQSCTWCPVQADMWQHSPAEVVLP